MPVTISDQKAGGRSRARPRGITAPEVLVATAIMAAVLIPTWTLFVSGRGMAVKSKYTYLALMAAREEIDDLRQMSHLSKVDPPALAHDWQPIIGKVMGRLVEPRHGMSECEVEPDLTPHQYTTDQARVFTRVEVRPSSDPRGEVWRATLWVRWQEHGERFTEASKREKPGLSRFDFVLVRPKDGQ